MSTLSEKTIKLYVNLKDKTERESIDPLSSITAALAKSEKTDTAFLRIDFSPLYDEKWRHGTPKKIFETPILPAFIKSILLSNWFWLKIALFPFTLTISFLSLLSHAGNTEEKTEDAHKKAEEKFDGFGYGVQLIVGKLSTNKTPPKEIASSLAIFSQSNGAKFEFHRPFQGQYNEIKKNYPLYRTILSSTELAGLVHLPTIYVQTP